MVVKVKNDQISCIVEKNDVIILYIKTGAVFVCEKNNPVESGEFLEYTLKEKRHGL